MLRLAIIADDLTGALDAAAPFAAIAGGVVVATAVEALTTALKLTPGVVAVSTRSREIAPDEAQARVARALADLPEGTRLFKKIDSRLKGNIGSELDAFGNRRLLVAPAIPDFGRVVREGRLEGFGVDAPIPVRSRLGDASERAAVPDSLTGGDLARAVREAGGDTVLVGARGLAVALARSMGVRKAEVPSALGAPICMAVGSSDPITLRQVERLCEAVPDVVHVPAPAGTVPSATTRPPALLSVLQMTAGEDVAPSIAADRFANGAAPWLRAANAIVLSGGATAEACLDALGIDCLSLRGEILPGLPLSEAADLMIVTKSGGFGEPDCLERLAGIAARDRAHG